MPSRLHKSQTGKMLAGVCAGLAEYFAVDPTIVRLIFVLFTFFNGFGLVAYIVLWIVMPQEGSLDRPPAEVVRENLGAMRDEVERLRPGARPGEGGVVPAGASVEGAPYTAGPASGGGQRIAGGLLVLAGVLLLLQNFNLFWWLRIDRLWPLGVIAIGLFILYDQTRRR